MDVSSRRIASEFYNTSDSTHGTFTATRAAPVGVGSRLQPNSNPTPPQREHSGRYFGSSGHLRPALSRDYLWIVYNIQDMLRGDTSDVSGWRSRESILTSPTPAVIGTTRRGTCDISELKVVPRRGGLCLFRSAFNGPAIPRAKTTFPNEVAIFLFGRKLCVPPTYHFTPSKMFPEFSRSLGATRVIYLREMKK